MADYWKSQPKKFCTYCKCWIADNKPSIEFHERGKNHKENVANKISEIKQRSMEKAKEEAKATKEFAAMEEAALKAYQEDLKRLGSDPVPTGQIATQSVILETQIKTKAVKQTPTRTDETPTRTDETPTRTDETPTRTDEWAIKDEWVEGVTPEGYTYYYNAAIGESRWEKPNSIQKSTEDLTKTAETSVWVEAVTEDGHTYYYNAETRESRWEKPEDFVPREDRLPVCSTTPTDVLEACTEPATTEFESECTASMTPESGSTETTVTAFKESESTESTVTTSKESNSDIEDGSQPGMKTEESESASEGPEHLKEEEIKMQAVKDEDTETEPTLGTSEDVQQHSVVGSVETNVRIARKPAVYGTWEEIKEEEDPYEKVDLELPTLQYDYSEATELDVPQEPKVKFKERTITSLGDAGAIGNPVFKKRKTENGKSRNIRQRISDT